jgi:pimeloyl-ACP methyl ester carboxylesterase
MADRATWRSPTLGEASEVQLRDGPIRYHEVGSGSTLVFVHGLLVNANLWRKVVARLSSDFRCVTLDLPLGAHISPMRQDADLSPGGVSNLIADAIEALGLEEVALVGNDTGGALSQLVATRRPERLGRLVLTSCDAFDNFPPGIFKYVLAPAMIPGAVPILFAPLRLRAPRRLPIAFGWVTKRSIEREAEDSYVYAALTNRGAQRDVRKLLRTANKKVTLEAAERLRDFRKPALIAWSREDRLFPPEHGERLAEILPDARLEWIYDSYAFSPEDQPDKLADVIAGFVREPRAAGVT